MQVQTTIGRPAIYPWGKWTDGNTHTAKFGRHFNCSVASFRQAIRRKAESIGVGVESKNVGIDAVKFRFHKS